MSFLLTWEKLKLDESLFNTTVQWFNVRNTMFLMLLSQLLKNIFYFIFLLWLSLEWMFCKNSQQEKAINFFCAKHSILDGWQSSIYTSVICYSLFGKTENPNNIDSGAL